MALALRFAGTANARAFKIIMEFIGRFRRIEPSKTDRPTLETCLVVCCMSMSVVMAGTGNVDGLRVLRALRGRVEAEVSYGHHLGIHMAIGFMFLGGGCCTFSNSNEAVVALVTALYPRFPSTPSDNSFHLQALRHLYVLAAEDRSLKTYDADNGKPCYAPIVVECKDGSVR
jgi:anaphase-promoting complex subunit 1